MPTARLERWTPKGALTICKRLHEAGFRAWIVGGCVRDALLAELNDTEREPHDWDLATDARPEEVMRVFRRVIPTGIEHGTVTVLVDREAFEVTTLRGDEHYEDGRRPSSVAFIRDLQEDLARRDFTVNAIAYNPLTATLSDPFDGMGDLRRRLIRAVGTPSLRFAEDGLRILRGARFVASLGFELESATAAAMQGSLDSYRKVSQERVRDEWLKTFAAPRPSRGFDVMREHGMLAITAPELMESVGCEQNKHHAFDVWGHTMACMDACPESPVLRMAGLLHDVGKPRSRAFNDEKNDYTFYNHEAIGARMAEPMLRRLKFSTKETHHIVALVRHHLICYTDEWTDAAVRRWLQRVTPDVAEDLYLLGRADALGKGQDPTSSLANIEALQARVARLQDEGTALTTRDLAISGKDLLDSVGLQPGPVIGRILRQLLEEVTDEPSRNTPATLLSRAQELAATEKRS